MEIEHVHWENLTPAQARNIQALSRSQVILEDRISAVRFVAGIDVGFEDKNKTTRAAIAVLTFPDLQLYCSAVARRPTSFPYIPGLLSFREIPAVLDAFENLSQIPDLLLCDGQGVAHPRRFGIACHLGVLTGIPSIGVAKSRLIGSHATVPEHKGQWVPLYDKEEMIGAVLRTRTGIKPLYISPGHKISLTTSLKFVLDCLSKYRLPETTRWAHRLASGNK